MSPHPRRASHGTRDPVADRPSAWAVVLLALGIAFAIVSVFLLIFVS